VRDLPWSRMRQPDQRSCGPSSLVAARMLLDPSYAEAVRAGGADRFGADVLSTHRRATGAVLAGRLQVPWPRALGTPPWAIARELSAASAARFPGTRYRWRVTLHDPAAAFERAAAATEAGRPVGLYVGNAWLPRHVVLAVARAGEDALWVYDPARGARVQVTRAAMESRSLTFGRWNRLWFDVSPR
jgi:hypothetical protein